VTPSLFFYPSFCVCCLFLFSHYSYALLFAVSFAFFDVSFFWYRRSSSLLLHLLPSIRFHFIYRFLLILYFTILYLSIIVCFLLSFRFEDYFFSFWRFCSENVGVFLYLCLSFFLAAGPHIRIENRLTDFYEIWYWRIYRNVSSLSNSISNRAEFPSYKAVLNFLLTHRQ
jgi:hypothetical protein